MPGARVKMVAKQAGSVRNDTGSLALVADYALAEASQPDIVVIPGDSGQTPFDAGAPSKATAVIVERLRSRSRFIMQ
jgi:putative intracellular protease/amidase